jgi:hypothetical protein
VKLLFGKDGIDQDHKDADSRMPLS